MGDVSQMYHQTPLLREDRPLHRFLRRDLETSKEPEKYEFLRYVFGGCYGPFCAQYVWQRLADDHKADYPIAAGFVNSDCYIDDLMPSLKTVEEAKEARRQLSELGDKAGFHLGKRISQRLEVIAGIPETDRATEVDFKKNYSPVTETLGALWVVQDDKFSFRYSPPPVEFEFTKGNVSKKTKSIFNPLGLLAPFIIRAKLFMHEAWIEALDWDEELPDYQKVQWKE